LFAPEVVAADDLYATLARCRWRPNVLLAGTLIDGTATISLPRALWDYAVVLLTDAFTDSSQPAPPLPTTAVPAATWMSWRSDIPSCDVAPCQRLWETLGRGDLSRAQRDLCTRLFSTTRGWVDASKALELVRAFAMGPALAREPDATERFAGQATAYPDFGAALRTLARVLA
jgi:hypothetical protein